MGKKMTKIIIVDKEDKVIGSKERGTLDYEKDIYRVAALWVTNSKNEVLLAKRALTKKHNPGKWGPAVAGTVDEGETYDLNIVKEAREELGLKDINPEKWIKNNTVGKQRYQHFTQWYRLKLDKSLDYFKLQEEEVKEIKWFNKDELKELGDADHIIDSIREVVKRELEK
jgi:isopentenyldiphosphate isomerase